MNETMTQNERERELNNRKLRQKPCGLVAGEERWTKRLREMLQARGLGLEQTGGKKRLRMTVRKEKNLVPFYSAMQNPTK